MAYQSSRRKIQSRPQLKALLQRLQADGKKVVFTNGCFDLLHPGHIRYLEKARAEGDLLVVALNSDSSVQRIKGRGRPILSEDQRCEVLAALECVDYVTVFSEETPFEIIEELLPNVLAKGGDWPLDKIVGRETVERHGGKVVSISFEQGFSTTNIIERISRRKDRADSSETASV